jgi:histidine triad (HIT) family protein
MSASNHDCVFCKIAAGGIPTEMVHEDGSVVAFRDLNPQAPVHVLIIPRKHIASMDDATADDDVILGRMLLAAREIAAAEGIAGAYRLVNNCGAPAGQSVFHIHLHLLGGRGMSWPPG